MPGHRSLVVGALSAVILCAGAASADWVVLKDGTRYQGKVIDESGVNIVADVMADGRRATKAFKKSEVKEVIKEPLPKGFFEKETGGAPAAAAPTSKADDDEGELPAGGSRLYYVEVPLVGTFGQDFDETGVEEALAGAKRRKVDHILFTLDSPGGVVATATAIQHIMTKYDADFTYYVRIKSAISASLWVLVCCDRVFWEDGANAGAAVAFRMDVKTGSATVDAKMIAALSSELAARAEQKRRLPPLLVRAMVDQEVAVYTRKDPASLRVIMASGVPTGEEKDWTELDSKTQVLALSKKQAMDLGFGEDWNRREILTSDWKLASKVGEAAMKRSRDRVHDFAKCVELTEKLVQTATAATKTRRARLYNDYDTETYYYRDRSGNYVSGTRRTRAAEALYASRDRAAVKAWEDVRDGAKEILKLLKKHEQLGLTEQMKEAKKFAELCEEKSKEMLGG